MLMMFLLCASSAPFCSYCHQAVLHRGCLDGALPYLQRIPDELGRHLKRWIIRIAKLTHAYVVCVDRHRLFRVQQLVSTHLVDDSGVRALQRPGFVERRQGVVGRDLSEVLADLGEVARVAYEGLDDACCLPFAHRHYGREAFGNGEPLLFVGSEVRGSKEEL